MFLVAADTMTTEVPRLKFARTMAIVKLVDVARRILGRVQP